MLLCFKCEKSSIPEEETKYFDISDAYFQKYIPGTEDGVKQLELGFSVNSLNEDIIYDSLYYQNKVYQKFKINENKIVVSSDEISPIAFQFISKNLLNNQAILFYSHFDKVYFCYVNDIVTRETIYLP